MILILLVYLLYACTFSLGKLILGYIDPIFFIAIRMMFAGALLLLVRKYIQKKPLQFSWNDKKLFALIVCFHIYIAYVLEFVALRDMNSTKVAIFYNFQPFITEALLYFSSSRRRISIQKIIGLCIGFVGMLWILFADSNSEEAIVWSNFTVSVPEILLLISVVSTAYGWIVVHKLVNKGYSALHINGIGMLIGGFAALITSLTFEGVPRLHIPTTVPFQDLFASLQAQVGFTNAHLLFLGVYCGLMILIANVIGYNLYSYLLNFYSPTFLSFAGFIAPLFAAVIGWVLLGESITYHFFGSLTLVTIGLWLLYRDEQQSNIVEAQKTV